MRLLVLSSLYPPHVGGAPAVVERFVTFLRGRGDDVEVATYGACDHERAAAEAQAQFDSRCGYPIHRVAADVMNAKAILALTGRVMALVARRWRRQRLDAIVCGVTYPCAAMARVVRIVFRTPYVVYAHGEDVSVVDLGSPRTVRVKRAILAWSLRGASTVFANSHATADRLRKVAPWREIEILPPTIDPGPFTHVDATRTEALRHELGLDEAIVLLTIARLTSPRKGHDVVVRALPSVADHYPSTRYVVVGSGDQTILRDLARTCGVDDRLLILESVSDDDIPLLMSMARIYVMPSRWDQEAQEGEGFGIVYLEAAAAGRPSVASDSGGSVDAVVPDVTGLTVDPESAEQVAAAILTLLGDPGRAAAMGAAGRARVVAEYSNDAVLPRLRAALTTATTIRRGSERQLVS